MTLKNSSLFYRYERGLFLIYLGAPALICWSGRSKPSFIPLKYLPLVSRANNVYHYVKHHLQLSCAQVTILVSEIFQLLEALLTAFCRAHIEQRLSVLTLRWTRMNLKFYSISLTWHNILRYFDAKLQKK